MGAQISSFGENALEAMGCGPEVPEPPSVFEFESGLTDCCAASPKIYKTVAEIPNARLVEMTMKPGEKDKPHEHPKHSMFFITDAKLAIRAPPTSEPEVAEVPAGGTPIFPAGARQVTNVGSAEAKAIFVEPYPTFTPCGQVWGFKSPFKESPAYYKALAEDEDWITASLTMKPGEKSKVHYHKDHLIYVLEGDEVTIYPQGKMDKGVAVPIMPFTGIPAPMDAPGEIFSKHVMKNTGKLPLKMIFFEMKK